MDVAVADHLGVVVGLVGLAPVVGCVLVLLPVLVTAVAGGQRDVRVVVVEKLIRHWHSVDVLEPLLVSEFLTIGLKHDRAMVLAGSHGHVAG